MPVAEQFVLPMRFELTAVFLFAVTGALLAIEKHYDIIGVFVLAFLSATGGGLVRDSIFLQRGAPLVLQDERYLYVIAIATVVCLILGTLLSRFRYVFLIADALGLGIYAVVGTELAIDSGLHVAPAAFVGMVNAVGGGVLRDVLTGQETLLFKPGEFYMLAAASGIAVFAALLLLAQTSQYEAAWWSIGTTFVMRLAAITFNWKTSAARPLFDRTSMR
jgi:uncharacterized membrane protein YeiH